MDYLTNIEKGAFLKLFNRGGYVLDFSTADFNAFTMDSVGVALCEKYGLSKGQSLTRFLHDANASDSAKLLTDLFDYYELNVYPREQREYQIQHDNCKRIIDRVRPLLNGIQIPTDNLKEAFSSEHIAKQLDLMLQMQTDNPTEAIGKAKELIESCCKTILERFDEEYDKNWDITKLVDTTVKKLKITPNDIPEDIPEAKSMKALLGNLRAIATNIATLRNSYGSGHGKSASYKGLQERHAKLAIGSSITLVNFLWDSLERNAN
ncbi:MAG: abortive infection family protein [Bacteroidales bacterium]|nr:abortive infection family protein [Bacteroidales bacterium]